MRKGRWHGAAVTEGSKRLKCSTDHIQKGKVGRSLSQPMADSSFYAREPMCAAAPVLFVSFPFRFLGYTTEIEPRPPLRKGRWHGAAVTEGSKRLKHSTSQIQKGKAERSLSQPMADSSLYAREPMCAAAPVLFVSFPFRFSGYTVEIEPKPPLRKGRWHGAAVTEGSKSLKLSTSQIQRERIDDPSVSLWLTAPFTQGSLCALPRQYFSFLFRFVFPAILPKKERMIHYVYCRNLQNRFFLHGTDSGL